MSRLRSLALAALLLGVATRSASAQIPRPEWAFDVGRTFAVVNDAGVHGGYDQGGFLVSGSALWPWQDRFRFGVTATAADLGVQLRGQTRTTSSGVVEDLGNFMQGHALAWGIGWRTDALGPKLGRIGRTYATGSYSFYRLTADSLGHSLAATSAVGVSAGAGIERSISPHMTLGLLAGGTWLSGNLGHFADAALAWHWRW